MKKNDLVLLAFLGVLAMFAEDLFVNQSAYSDKDPPPHIHLAGGG